MASVSFDASELNKLAADLGIAAPRVGASAATVVRRTAAAIERDAKIFVPVDTGNLKNSISTDILGSGAGVEIEAQIGPTASYGVYVELGTSRMAPHAYMGPALDRNSPGFVDAMGQVVGDIL